MRSAAAFAALALFLSLVLSVATYELARWYLLGQRESLAVKQALLHAQVVDGQLNGLVDPTDEEVLSLLLQTKSRSVLRVGSQWYSAVVDLDQSRVPQRLVDATQGGQAYQQRVRVNEQPYFVVAVPLQVVDSLYVEFVPSAEFERTLRTLALVLAGVASMTTVVGALSGWLLSRRVLRPLDSVAASATAIADGDLHRRLDVENDPDLQPVAEAFNSMAEALSARIAREQRFTADVSHELRTPLTAMSSAVALAQRSRTAERTEFAIDVLSDQVDHLRRLTLELLELARVDAGREANDRELVDVGALIRRQAQTLGAVDALEGTDLSPMMFEVNVVRLDRVMANLLENAARYGGGATAIRWCRHHDALRITVDDGGPGVPPGERQTIFERFHRGTAVAAPTDPKGTGLGLALVQEYVALEGGAVWVEDAPGGGARFVVEIPSRRP